MEIFTEDFGNFILFQDLENVLVDNKKKLAGLELKKLNLNENYKSKITELNIKNEAFKKKLFDKKELENELLILEDEILKRQIQLNQVKKNDEFKAMLSQIETLKLKKDDIESKIIEMIDIIDNLSKEINDMKKDISEYEKIKKIEENSIDMEKSNIETNIKEILNKQNEILKNIKDQTTKIKVDNIMGKKDRIAIAKVKAKINEAHKEKNEDYFCSACNMKLTSAESSSLRKAKTFIICQNCSRLLYLEGTDYDRTKK